jgi:hypothetical protein
VGLYANAFYDVVQETGVELEEFRKVGDGDGVIYADRVNNFVRSMREVVRSAKFKRQYDSVEFVCKGNYKRSLALLRSIYDRCESMTIVRFDLYPSSNGVVNSPGQVEFLTQSLIVDLRGYPFYPDMAGYITAPQYSRVGGVSAHLMILFDGVQDEAVVAHSIYNEWVGKINSGSGCVKRCSGHPNIYKDVGNGVINRGDLSLYYEVMASLSQWAKVGLFIPLSQDFKVVRLR